MESNYPDPISKISLTVAVGQSAKTQLVKEEGIGEELAINILGWKNGELVCVAQMDTSWKSTEFEKIQRTGDAYMIMRRGWLCDSFTILAEGYMSKDPEKTKGYELEDAFLDNTKGVTECLTINYVDADEVHLCAIPFKMSVGRKVKWGKLVHSDSLDVLRNNDYVVAAAEVLSQEEIPIPDDAETFHLALAVGLSDSSGYFIQYDL